MNDIEKMAFEILKSREDRAAFQEKLIDKYKHSLISFTLNIPGPIKDRPEYREIHEIGMKAILDELDKSCHYIDFVHRIEKNTGPEGYISVNIDPKELKKITTEIERNHPLGRLFDMDILDENHNQVSRRDLGLEFRKCLICKDDAKICSRAGTHSLDDLLARIMEIYDMYLSF